MRRIQAPPSRRWRRRAGNARSSGRSLAASLLREAWRAALAGRLRRSWGIAHLLGVARRNLVVRHRYSDDGPRDAFGCDEGPWSAVAAGIEPRAVVKGVVAPTVDEEIEVHARGVRDRTVGHDDDPRRRGQDDGRRCRDADVHTDVHLRGE